MIRTARCSGIRASIMYESDDGNDIRISLINEIDYDSYNDEYHARGAWGYGFAQSADALLLIVRGD